MISRRLVWLRLASVGLVLGSTNVAVAATKLEVALTGNPSADTGATALKIIAFMTLLSLAPAILLAATSFLRIMVVLSFVRTALGVQGTPPTQVLTGLALFMTLAIMAPVGTRIYDNALKPYLDGTIEAPEAYASGSGPLREFMLRQTRETDLRLFYEINRASRPIGPEDVPLHLLVPAFVTSELRTGFEMGFMVLIPFLVVDLVVASILMALGMVMLPPSFVSLPIKVLVFVLVDGWHLLVGSLVRSFG